MSGLELQEKPPSSHDTLQDGEIQDEPKFDEDYVHPSNVISSDNWKYEAWSENIWVITDSRRCAWMEDLLLSYGFRIIDHNDGEGHKFQIHGDQSFKNKVASCSGVIFYFDNDTWKSEFCDDMKHLIDFYKMKTVLFVFGGDEAANISSDVEATVQTWNEDQECRHKVIHFTDRDMLCGRDLKDKIGRLKTWLKEPTHPKIRIFSRSVEEEYKWLILLLDSFPSHVQPSRISNYGRKQFIADVHDCMFGILYHTKNRGRINITDVTDSLYDEELDYMSAWLGKSHVMVVVDDLEDASEEKKNHILAAQSSIKEKTHDLLLFTPPEKMCLEKLRTLQNFIKGGGEKI